MKKTRFDIASGLKCEAILGEYGVVPDRPRASPGVNESYCKLPRAGNYRVMLGGQAAVGWNYLYLQRKGTRFDLLVPTCLNTIVAEGVGGAGSNKLVQCFPGVAPVVNDAAQNLALIVDLKGIMEDDILVSDCASGLMYVSWIMNVEVSSVWDCCPVSIPV